ncbi:hypothetical protein ACOME3_005369 [Neoechinorhynchus agilis]
MRSAIVFGLIFALGFVAVSANHRRMRTSVGESEKRISENAKRTSNEDSAETTAVQNEVRNQRRNTEKMEGDGMDEQKTSEESISGDDTSNGDSTGITEGENGLGNGGIMERRVVREWVTRHRRNRAAMEGDSMDKQKTSRNRAAVMILPMRTLQRQQKEKMDWEMEEEIMERREVGERINKRHPRNRAAVMILPMRTLQG